MTLEYLENLLAVTRSLGVKGSVVVKVQDSVIHDLAHFADSANIEKVSVETLVGEHLVVINC